MTESSSGQKRWIWIVLLMASVVLISIADEWRRLPSPQSPLAEESQEGLPKSQGLPDDLVGVSDANYASLDGLAAGSKEAQERQRQTVQQLGLPLEVTTRKTGIVFRLIPAGSFTMGSPKAEQDAMVPPGFKKCEWIQDETEHKVTLSKAFYCGKYEVTQEQWEQAMGSNPSRIRNAGKEVPVENVSWKDCQEFLKKLCQREGVPEGTYRLLTEAQWEYACRAGTHTAFCYGNALDSSLANFDGEYPCGGGPTGPYRQTTVAVGSFQANAWGLCEMHGNVWEWCEDGYGAYASGAVRDPLGLVPGGDRVARGGDWGTYASGCRSAIRCGFVAGNRNAMLGLRFARTTLFPPQRKEAERM